MTTGAPVRWLDFLDRGTPLNNLTAFITVYGAFTYGLPPGSYYFIVETFVSPILTFSSSTRTPGNFCGHAAYYSQLARSWCDCLQRT